MKKWLLLRNTPISRLENKNHTTRMAKSAKINMAEKPYPLGPYIPIEPTPTR